jgi:RNA polymerase subunit RPABC4/transcription elongation factor Spt4
MTDDAQANSLLTCRHCHGQFPELVERCPWCGKQIALHCAHCGELTDDSTPLCAHCGQPHSPAIEQAASPHVSAPPIVVARSVTPAPVVKPPEPPMEVVATWRELRGPWRVFAMSEWIMRDRASFFEEIRARSDLSHKLRSMVVSTIIYLALYGLVMGISNSWQQALMSALKLPVLFLVTLLICLPTLYFFNLLYGSQLTFGQTAALIMAAVTITAALTLAFASITLFFWLTVPDYEFFVLLNVGVLAITAWWGLSFLRQGMRHIQRVAPQARRILAVWVAIYAFVGTQMGWALKPFFGAPGQPFEFIRRTEGTFYTSVFRIILGLLGFRG